MPQTATQIVTLATQIAKCPRFTSQAGQLLNSILSELCQNYDFDTMRGLTQFNFNSSVVQSSFNQSFNTSFGPGLSGGSGIGPYYLPPDYLRASTNDVFYTVSGVPYFLTNVDNAQYDQFVQTAGLSSYPEFYTTIVAPTSVYNVMTMYVWPPPSGSYPVTMRYFRQAADIPTPETSTTVPWFPDGNYLVTRLAGELMKLTDDERVGAFLGDGPMGAQGILNRYLKMKDDSSDRVKTVGLDRRRFGAKFSTLSNTKKIGW